MTLNRNGFQNFVNRELPPAVVGDFASMNPRATALAGPDALRSTNALGYDGNVANPVIGRFAWGQNSLASSQKPAGSSVAGFVANELQTVIPFLAPGAGDNPVRLAVQTGFPVTLYVRGDFWAIPQGALLGAVSPGDVVYARQYDGEVTNDPVAFAATGVQALTTLTVSAVTKGFLVPGMVVDSSGADATVITQLTGTPGGAGTYTVSTSATVGSGPITANAVDTGFTFQSATAADASAANCSLAAGTGILTVGAITGTIEVGQNVTGTGLPANLFVQAIIDATHVQLNTVGPAVAGPITVTFSQGKLAKISRS